MSDESKWASFVRAHRLAQNYNQSEFAKAIGVSQQTVSRWESGGQIPDSSIQVRLKEQLQATALGSLAFWKRRVSTSRGHDVLIARDLTILAISDKAARLLGEHTGSLIGSVFPDLLPEPDLVSGQGSGLASLRQLSDIGFFDGLIRSVRLKAEWHVALGSCTCQTDVWPVLTSDQTIVGHFAGTPVSIPKDASGYQGIRVLDIDIQLNKD